jgi:hypothetical protein
MNAKSRKKFSFRRKSSRRIRKGNSWKIGNRESWRKLTRTLLKRRRPKQLLIKQRRRRRRN